MKEILIKKEFSNQRADKFVRKFLNDAPLSFIYKLFRKKDVKVNKHWIKQNYILQENDLLEIYVSEAQLLEFNNPKKIENIQVNLNIIYEDKNILVVNKPTGILIHGDENEKRITLSNKVLSYLYNKHEFNPNEQGFIPGPVHRLDRNTSGVVIFAKNIIASQLLMQAFKNHEGIIKHYLALVKGKINKSGEINAPLIKDANTGLVKVDSISQNAKTAITTYELIDYKDDLSLVDVLLVTGRTHQIRVHFAYINHPLVGDNKYGDFAFNKEFKKKYNFENQFLHAYSLSFINLKGELSYLNNKVFSAKLDEKKKEILSKIYSKLK